MNTSGDRHFVNTTPTGDVFFVGTTGGRESAAVSATAFYRQLQETLHRQGSQIVQERIFGSLTVEAEVRSARRAVMGDDGPLNYIEGVPFWGEGLAGIIVRAVTRQPVVPVTMNGVIRGRAWNGQLILQALHGEPGDVIAEAARLLQERGVTFRQVARTWFYLDRILDWYDEFNRIRNAAYTQVGLIGPNGTHLPASTGIHGRNRAGHRASLDLLAVTGEETFDILHNPRQPEALNYGSAFARAVRVDSLLELSGTAAIDAAGRSVHEGNAPAQVAHMMEAIAALIQPAGVAVSDMVAGCLFLKRREDRGAVAQLLADLPLVGIHTDVCRAELLVEVDAEFAIPTF